MRRAFFFWIGVFLLGLFCPFNSARSPVPTITSITVDSTNVLVKVSVPSGIRKVTLEGRPRLGASSWAPRSVRRFDTLTAGQSEISFLLPRSESIEVLRVRADDTEPLPLAFFSGTNQFSGPQSSSLVTPMSPGGVTDMNNPGATGSVGGGSTERAVVESDIWKVAGDTLYFFNNLRGLQVIDISNPDAPGVRGSYPLAASGEQMYVLPSGHAVLLTRSWCSGNDESKVVVIDTVGVPKLASETTVPGYVTESRLVGSALYVVSQAYQQHTTDKGVIWDWGTLVTSIDLANPAAPVKRNTLFLAGYGGAISATDRFLFVTAVSDTDYYRSNLQIIDISSPDGAINSLATITAFGLIADKFKINMDGDTLTVISHHWDTTFRWTTSLDNYSLANPKSPQKLGSLQLAQGDQLHATRFDGKRAYIVTFLRIDPLWIVDLTDPAHPAIAGELSVPGWSTYLQPMGDRVLALGVDNTNSWRVALSLFDVSNAHAPTLLSKVALGENSSWSEASDDEKALTVLPDAGLILVPWQGYTTNGYSSQVQLIDLATNKLTARGQITGQMYPRRATLSHDHVLSLSGRSLVSYAAADRDHPEFKAELNLAWPVNKVILAGDYLLEIETGAQSYWWGNPATPAHIRVTRANAPETILNTITFTNNLSIAGVELRDNKLYVAQSTNPGWNFFPIMILATVDGTTQTNQEPQATFVQSIYDASALPALPLLGSSALAPTNQLGVGLTALWPKTNVLVWSGGLSWGGWWGGPVMAMDMIARPIFWGGSAGSGHFLAFDVANPAAPALKSEVDLTSNNFFNFSKPILSEGLIYLSHQTQEFVEIPTTNSPAKDPASTTGWGGTNITVGVFVTRYFLDVLDYADSANPVVRKPANIPGQLQGVSHSGGVIYTLGNHFDAIGNSDFVERLDASAYDGVSVFLIDSLSLTNWPHPVSVQGRDIFIGQSLGKAALDRWRLSDMGLFEKLSTTPMDFAVNTVRFLGDMAIVQANTDVLLLDAAARANLKLIGAGPYGCSGGASLDDADGALGRGLWIPQTDYGVSKINVTAAP